MQTSKNIFLKFIMRRFFGFAALAAFCFPALSPSPAFAAITQSINYQGFLLSKITNLPVETPQNIKFVIYDTPAGGTARFQETRCNLRMSKGRYDVEIGSVTPGGLPVSLFTDYSGLWLEIQVGTGGGCGGTYEAMTPRVKLQASPFAFNSLYASTASAATPVFLADVIGALPNTQFGAVTISSNLFVQGGISVGSISPGQKLAVAGVVESTGVWPGCADPANYTCGFKFPDGSVQVKAAALTMWDILGDNLFSINPGNVNIGGGLTAPQARLHISSGAGETGDLLLVSTGTGADQSKLFRVNGLGEVHGLSYYGDGSTLSGLVLKAGDTMTGQLTLAGSSLTVTSALGVSSPKLKLKDNVEISAAPPAFKGGVFISSHIYLAAGSTYYGDGSGLYNVSSTDTTKVMKTGDTMTGPLNVASLLTVSTLAVTNSAFSVSGTTFSVLNGNTALGGGSYLARLTVNGGVIATSSITAQAGLYTTTLSGTGLASVQTVRASSATFWGYNGPDDANTYSITTASGIRVNLGVVNAPGGFIGDGSQLTNVTGTDNNRVRKTGDNMTGHLRVLNSSITVLADSTQEYALTVNRADTVMTDPGASYVMAVTTWNVGVQVLYPTAPLEVNKEILISNADPVGARAQLHIRATDGDTFIRWSDPNSAFGNKGALGYQYGYADLIYRAMGSDPGTGGQEVFRIGLPSLSVDPASWQFGIGTTGPNQTREKFHVMTNMLVSTSAANAILYISTSTGRVSINTAVQTHALTVNGGIHAASSVTAQGGYYGDQSGVVTVTGTDIRLNGNTGVGISASPDAVLQVGEKPGAKYSLAVGTHTNLTDVPNNTYDFVVTTWGRVGIGLANAWAEPLNEPSNTLQVMKSIRIGAESYGDQEAYLSLRPTGGPTYIVWGENQSSYQNKGVLGFAASSNDLIYRGGASAISNGVEVFRITGPADGVDFNLWKFGIGTNNPAEKFHVATNMLVGASGSTAALFVSPATGSVGISTGAPKERMHVASSFLVGPDRASAALYVSTQSGYTGIGTGSPQAKLDVNGLGAFRSSMTIAGTNLTDAAQSALEVIGSTLVVKNDGKVGIGVAAPAERLDVAGKVKAAGFKASRERISNACGTTGTCVASCTAGKLIIGGGCIDAAGSATFIASYPSSDTAWTCVTAAVPTNLTAYAICSTLE